LLAKLYHYGIRGTVHKWFCSYLTDITDKTQQVAISGKLYEMNPIIFGVPQGSIHGFLLF